MRYMPLIFLVMASNVFDASAQQIEWKRVFGTNSGDYPTEVAADTLGNIFVGGNTGGSLDGDPLGNGDAFLTKFSPHGDLLWSRQFGSTAEDYLHRVAIDNLGNVYAAGYTWGNVHGTNAGGRDAFIAKFDADGNRLWTRQFGTATDDEAVGLTADESGNFYVSGYTWGDLAAPAAGAMDAFVTKFDSAGNSLWSRQFGTPTWEIAQDVTTDGLGNIYLTGETYGDLAGPNGGGPNSSWEDVFVIKLDAAGSEIWARQFGSPTQDISYDSAADSAGGVYFAGRLYDESRDLITAYVANYNADGNLRWTREPGTVGNADYSRGVATDGRGRAYVSSGSTGFAGFPDPPSVDVFVNKYDTEGNVLWTSTIGSRGEYVDGLAFDGRQNVYAIGVTFNGLSEESNLDAFLVKIVDQTVPEPATFLSLAFGLVAASALRRPRIRR
jgi:hypothetical protein